MILIVSSARMVFAPPPPGACVTLVNAVALSNSSVRFDVVASTPHPVVVSDDMVVRQVNRARFTVQSPKRSEFGGEQPASSSPPQIQNGSNVRCQWCFAGKWCGRVMRICLPLAAAAAAAANCWLHSPIPVLLMSIWRLAMRLPTFLQYRTQFLTLTLNKLKHVPIQQKQYLRLLMKVNTPGYSSGISFARLVP